MKFSKIHKQAEKESEALHKARLEKCIPIAKEVSKLLQDLDLPLGDEVQNSKAYETAALKVLELFLEKEVLWVDREFIFQLALQPLSFTKEIVTSSLQNSWTHTLHGLFGKPMNKLTMADVNNALRKTPDAGPEETLSV